MKSTLLKVKPNRDAVETEGLWTNALGLESWLGSSVLVGDFIHTSCGQRIEWKTGKKIERLAIPPRSTMTCAEGFLIHRTSGNIVLLHEATPDGYVKRGEFTPPVIEKAAKAGYIAPWTFPVIAGGRLYLRDQDVLFCYDVQATKQTRREPDAIFVPTPEDVVEKMLTLAAVKKSDVVCDLGCGDGRIVVAAAKKYGCKVLGVDLDPECVRLARDKAAKEGMAARDHRGKGPVHRRSEPDRRCCVVSSAPTQLEAVAATGEAEVRARIVSHEFPIDGIEPDQVLRHVSAEDGVEHRLYLWTTPLKKQANK